MSVRALMKKPAPAAPRAARIRSACTLDRVEALAADDLILEIAADRAGRRQLRDIGRHASGSTA